ncbi:hypothetical protein OIU79_012410 [Salix purpurea]|uniref:Uncharacterized protein n=1 Tax=Salix purpurea TaxID=77065 RepID=A0A9Q0T2P2_SALPP|nr:hypothetical protein OIU79_012410 [Salix purpurea]
MNTGLYIMPAWLSEHQPDSRNNGLLVNLRSGTPFKCHSNPTLIRINNQF